MSVTESYLAALLVILSLPWALWRVLGRPVWAPLVVRQLSREMSRSTGPDRG